MTTPSSSLVKMVTECQLCCMSMMHSAALAAGSPRDCAEKHMLPKRLTSYVGLCLRLVAAERAEQPAAAAQGGPHAGARRLWRLSAQGAGEKLMRSRYPQSKCARLPVKTL